MPTYTCVVELKKSTEIELPILGEVTLPKGFYVYVGPLFAKKKAMPHTVNLFFEIGNDVGVKFVKTTAAIKNELQKKARDEPENLLTGLRVLLKEKHLIYYFKKQPLKDIPMEKLEK